MSKTRRWRVSGADRETGEPAAIDLRATGPRDARAQSSRAGIVAADCKPVGPESLARDELIAMIGAGVSITLLLLAIAPTGGEEFEQARREALSGAGAIGALLVGSVGLCCSTAVYIAHRIRHD